MCVFRMMNRKENKQERSERLPNRFFRIGDSIRFDGVLYKVIERPYVERPSQVCNGCDLHNKGCERLQCSKFDRVDGKNVWFVKIEKA